MKSILLLLAILMLTACSSGGSQLQAITPLPPASDTPVVQPSATVMPTATQALPATPTSALDALFANAPTATPLNTDLPAGNARAIALATDTALVPTVETPLSFESEPVLITFDEFYDGYNMRTGLILSDKLLSLDGRTVSIEGYMAPPLKARLDYFVLTRIRLAFCPFCSTAADWPNDIALVYLPPDQTTVATERPVRVVGRMEIGISVDQETGMVSLVRLYAEAMETLG